MSFLKNTEGLVLSIAGALLPAGTFDVVVRLVKEVTDHDADLNGTPKENYPFKNVHNQIAVILACDKGTILRRFNTEGYLRWDELEPKMRTKYNRHPQTGYAVDKKGNRIEDPKRTADCQSIFNQFINTLEKPTGGFLIEDLAGKPVTDLNALFKMMTGTKCRIVVENRTNPETGEQNAEVKSFKRISAAVAVAAGDDEDEGDLA